MKRKRLNVFSLSFLDIITCGLGAIILLFVLVNAKGAVRRDTVTADLQAEVNLIENQVLEGKKQLILARNVLEKTLVELAETQGRSRQVIETIKDKKIELADSDKDTLASKPHVNKLKADLKSLEEDVKRLRAGAKAQDELGTKLRPFPGQGDRQYLTDLKMGGRRILILADASASMLAESIVDIIRRRNLQDRDKLKSAKWRQAVATVDWLTARLPPTSRFQVYTFNESARPLMGDNRDAWLNAGDLESLNQLIKRIQSLQTVKIALSKGLGGRTITS